MDHDMNINQILLALASDSSRTAKETMLKEHENNTLLKRVIVAALDTSINYYIKKIPAHVPDSNITPRSLEQALDALEDFSSRLITGNAAIAYLVDILSSLNADDAEVMVKIIRRDLKCGVSTSTVNKVWKGLVKDYPCLLCSPYDEKLIKKFSWPAYDQLKADGLRFNAIVVKDACSFFSRSGSPIELQDTALADEFIKLAAGGDYMFDGEMVCYRDGVLLPRKEGNGIANKAIKGTITAEDSKLIVGVVWDVIPHADFVARKCDIPYKDRFAMLNKLMSCAEPPIKISVIETVIINSFEEALEIFNKRLALGLEGDIIKNMNGLWSDSRSRDQIKLKSEKECELRVTGWNPGEPGSKYENALGSLRCESEDGLVVVNVSGWSDEERRTITLENSLGRIVSVLYNERITKKTGGVDSLFLPRIVEFREDKSVADVSSVIK